MDTSAADYLNHRPWCIAIIVFTFIRTEKKLRVMESATN